MSRAYLTIDDISTPYTPDIVDFLCDKGIKPILFSVGVNVNKYRKEAIYALRKGIILGNHSYSHPAFSSLSLDEAKEEIDRQEEVLDALYEEAGVPRCIKVFRFPYGDKGGDNREAIQEYLRGKGFSKLDDRDIDFEWYQTEKCAQEVDTFWTFDFAEYQIRPSSSFTYQDVVDRVYDRNPGNPSYLLESGSNHIVLIHDHAETEEMEPGYFKRLIELVLEEGVEFVEPKFLPNQELNNLREFFAKDLYAAQAGCQIDAIADGYARCSLDITPKHMNAVGALMGGVPFTLADFCFAVATNRPGLHTVSVHSNIAYLGTPKGNKLIAQARKIKDGKRTCYYEIEINDELDKQVAVVQITGLHMN